MRKFAYVVLACLATYGFWVLIESDSPKDLQFSTESGADLVPPGEVTLVSWDSEKDSVMSGSYDTTFNRDSVGSSAEAEMVLTLIFERQKVIYENGKCYEHDIRNFLDVIPTRALNRYTLRLVCGCGSGYELKAKSLWAECTINEYGDYVVSPPVGLD